MVTEDKKTMLDDLHPSLRNVLDAAESLGIRYRLLETHRSRARQKQLFDDGLTKTLDSLHCEYPAEAFDIVPVPFRSEDWRDKRRFYFLAGALHAIARTQGIRLRWGGDWDSDGDFRDQKFDDLVHFELLKPNEEVK